MKVLATSHMTPGDSVSTISLGQRDLILIMRALQREAACLLEEEEINAESAPEGMYSDLMMWTASLMNEFTELGMFIESMNPPGGSDEDE